MPTGEDLPFWIPTAYAVVVCTIDRAPLLARPRLARIAAETWQCAVPAEGAVEVGPMHADQSRAVLHTGDPAALNRWVEAYKACSEALLLDAIVYFYADDLIDRVTRFNPVWPGVIYRVWETGFHRQPIFPQTIF
jgi:hypothetical protein